MHSHVFYIQLGKCMTMILDFLANVVDLPYFVIPFLQIIDRGIILVETKAPWCFGHKHLKRQHLLIFSLNN